MANESKHYVIVVGVDYSEVGDGALDDAIRLAATRNAELHVLYVDDHFRAPEGGREAVERELERLEHHAISRMSVVVKAIGSPVTYGKLYAHFRIGSPADQIVQLASDLEADTIVVGTNGRRGVQRFILGSVSERVVRFARCPVLVVRPKDHEGIGRVPEIEPPCPDCLAKRSETKGATFWCARHSEHHVWGRPFRSNGESMVDASAEPYQSTPA